ncbi:sulfur oxidation c-type cytochrome SoxX [Devosia rhizoryzae]|uniref:Sulfur oxidation c-type cytochrome SoxX n=1 Tax=Devosia rhizoryzae TaxID=2774137 RepID=A0ABX7C9N5_9HYPH|nr:sulfur oxidation c-type cytochrome SoxX [Devosia rhizoryzae]QQR39295.1 sulfur oxidation c-type cytochrome SoxX [Devosia rhizoryzae]
MLTALGASAGAQEIAEPLTAVPGDAARGKAVAVNSDMGNCLICHDVTIPELTPGSSGDIGPSLDGVGSRLSEGELRQRIVDPRVIAPDTLMPAYHSTEGFTRVDPRYAGKPILDAQEVEDLIAFLLTLK